MSNITTEWKIGNTTFNAIELDEEISLLSDVGNFIGEKSVFLNQEIETSRLKVLAYSENVNLLRKEIYSNNKLKLERYDNRIQYVEPESSNAVKTPPNIRANQIELNFITSDPYKYSKTRNASTVNLNETNTELFIYPHGQFETPLEFAIESYNMNKTTQSFGSTNTSIKIIGVDELDNMTFSKLIGIPSATWFEKEGMLLPTIDNKSGWIWEECDVGTKLEEIDANKIYRHRTLKEKDNNKYGAEYFKFSYHNVINADILQLQISRFAVYFYDIETTGVLYAGSPSLYLWNIIDDDWELIDTQIDFYDYYRELNINSLSDYLLNNRLHFLMGHERALPQKFNIYDQIRIYVNQIGVQLIGDTSNLGYETVSIVNSSRADYEALSTLYIEGGNNFDGEIDVTIHPATIINQSNRSFQPSTILHSETINGTSFSGEHEIKSALQGNDVIAIKLNSNYSGSAPFINLYNSSRSGDGMLFYRENLDGNTTFNTSYNFETFVKKVDYYTPAKTLKIKNYLNQNSESIFENPFLGKVYHYNTSDYYIFNPFNNLSSAVMYTNANANISNDKIYLNQSGTATFEICSLVPFSGIPEGNWSGTGNLSAYITLNETSDFYSWDDIGFHNSSYYFSMYNSDCDIIGKKYYFLRLNSNSTAVVSDLNIKSAASFSGKGFPYLHPNITNPVYISGDNLNSSVIFDYSWRDAFL